MTKWEATEGPITGGEKATAWVLLGIAVVVGVAGKFLGWWQAFIWFDEVVHGFSTFAITLVLALYLYGSSLRGAADHGFALVLTIVLLGLGLGALWEIAEWAYDQMFTRGSTIQGKTDTITDLIVDTAGALLAGIVARAMARE